MLHDVATGKHLISPEEVFPVLHKHILADGYDFVLDIKKSHGRRMVEERTGGFCPSCPCPIKRPE